MSKPLFEINQTVYLDNRPARICDVYASSYGPHKYTIYLLDPSLSSWERTIRYVQEYKLTDASVADEVAKQQEVAEAYGALLFLTGDLLIRGARKGIKAAKARRSVAS